MNKIVIDEKTNSNMYLNGIAQKTCDCYVCGACLRCIVFAPFVVLFLSVSLLSSLGIENVTS